MRQLIFVYDHSELSQHKVYQINGTLYRYTGKCPWARIDHPQWCFEPLAGQRKNMTLKLNQTKVKRVIYEVPGMVASRKAEVVGEAIQQSLF
ncbi:MULTISPECIES: hypothetical protein [unclassified Calothrix]|uniref:hypothetical protein n=1 Tax=unclassified Calothrix TaxID=2619626 RepID=UPI0018F02A5D|nr:MULTISPECIES: hypothetical protein [unclassified Calothrix]